VLLVNLIEIVTDIGVCLRWNESNYIWSEWFKICIYCK